MGLWTRIKSAIFPSPSPRQQVVQRRIRGTYDSARLGDEFANYWANADRFDADSANSKEVRHRLISHSRYENANNPYADGIAQTYATDLIGGEGPKLRMRTGSKPFNQLVERVFYQWTRDVQFRRKLWCLAHAKHTDGEAFAVIRRNPRVRHRVAIDLQLYEAEQVQTPYLPFAEPGYIDGIKCDEFGNPLWYDVLQHHPGAGNTLWFKEEPERVPADSMLHWFKLRRPGQHRAVPEIASSLNTGAAFRRMREAIIAAVETAADYSVLIKSAYSPERVAEVDPLEAFDIEKRMAVTLPEGWDAFQMKSEHPNSTYAEFHRTLINEQGRSKNMPYAKAACDSSRSNYASGRLDHQAYHANLDVDRQDCNDQVLDPLFEVWFSLAVGRYGWLGGDIGAISRGAFEHSWDWPMHVAVDVIADAKSKDIKLKSGQVGLHQIYTQCGEDLEDEIPRIAETFGVDESELRRRLFDILYPPTKQEQPAASKKPMADQYGEGSMNGAAVINRMNGAVNGALNGARHG